jgi:hypothetical protein
VVRLLIARGHAVHTVGYGHGLARFNRNGVPCRQVEPIRTGDATLLRAIRPALVVTSATSLPVVDMSEKHLWRAARDLGIPSLAFLDQWQNYSSRFSGLGEGERLAYLPDAINCMNDVGRDELLAEGFDAGRLVDFGHPALSELGRVLRELDPEPVAALLAERLTGVAPGEAVLFASEPIREHYGDSRGYDQYQVLARVLRAPGAARILLKLHPKDSRASYDELVAGAGRGRVAVVQDELTARQCLLAARLVVGMSSMLLVEAFVAGLPVLSVQPGLRGPDPLVLSRRGLVPLVTGGEELDLGPRPGPPPASFAVDFRAEAFLQWVEQHAVVARAPARTP